MGYINYLEHWMKDFYEDEKVSKRKYCEDLKNYCINCKNESCPNYGKEVENGKVNKEI